MDKVVKMPDKSLSKICRECLGFKVKSLCMEWVETDRCKISKNLTWDYEKIKVEKQGEQDYLVVFKNDQGIWAGAVNIRGKNIDNEESFLENYKNEIIVRLRQKGFSI